MASKSTSEQIFDAFVESDKDNSGFVTFDEARPILMDQLGLSEKIGYMYFKVFDKNDDGKLSYKEFTKFFFKVREKRVELKTIFNEFDANQDGYISLDEARNAMQDLAFESDELEQLFMIYDTNHDGMLEYEEFVKLWNAE